MALLPHGESPGSHPASCLYFYRLKIIARAAAVATTTTTTTTVRGTTASGQ